MPPSSTSAAHRELPLGTRVRVTHLESGRQVELRINDRGPFIRGRILDLSYGAAQRLGIVQAGLARVEIEVLAAPPAGQTYGGPTSFVVQAGAFRSPAKAESLTDRLRAAGLPAETVAGEDGLYRVWVGEYERKQKAREAVEVLRRMGVEGVVIGRR